MKKKVIYATIIIVLVAILFYPTASEYFSNTRNVKPKGSQNGEGSSKLTEKEEKKKKFRLTVNKRKREKREFIWKSINHLPIYTEWLKESTEARKQKYKELDLVDDRDTKENRDERRRIAKIHNKILEKIDAQLEKSQFSILGARGIMSSGAFPDDFDRYDNSEVFWETWNIYKQVTEDFQKWEKTPQTSYSRKEAIKIENISALHLLQVRYLKERLINGYKKHLSPEEQKEIDKDELGSWVFRKLKDKREFDEKHNKHP